MRCSLVLIALLAVPFGVGCKKAPEPVPPPVALPPVAPPPAPVDEDAPDAIKDLRWEAISADAHTVLTQTADLRGECVTACVLDGKEQWRGDVCMGKRLDLRFVANDCARVVVLHQLPKAAKNPPATEVAHVYAAGGKLDYAIAGGAAVRDWSKVRSGGTTFYWLSGVLGQPGERPRYTADGSAVELWTVDGAGQQIPLRAGAPKP